MTDRPGSFEALEYEVRERVALVTLARPAALNALDRALRAELRTAIGLAGNDAGVGAIVLTGAGRAFCVGQDLREIVAEREAAGTQPDFAALVRREYNPIVLGIATIPKPVVAAINGTAAGAGLSLALACDLRVAAEDAALVAAFGRVGLVPDSGMSWVLPRLVGIARAAEILLSGAPVNAAEAERIGLVNRVVSAETLVDDALDLARTLAEGSPLAIQLTKRQLRAALDLSLEEALDLEARNQGTAGRSPEHAEGLRAFLEKRRPRFRDP